MEQTKIKKTQKSKTIFPNVDPYSEPTLTRENMIIHSLGQSMDYEKIQLTEMFADRLGFKYTKEPFTLKSLVGISILNTDQLDLLTHKADKVLKHMQLLEKYIAIMEFYDKQTNNEVFDLV